MYKIFLTLLLALSLNAEIVGGVAIVVKGQAITLYDIKKEMQLSKIDAKRASDVLIRKALEKSETKERKITVSSGEVYDDIKKSADRNRMSVNDFYEAVRNSNGMSSSDLKEKIKSKLLSQKLYGAIVYSSMSEPSQEDIEAYLEQTYKFSLDNIYSIDDIKFEQLKLLYKNETSSEEGFSFVPLKTNNSFEI